MTTPSRRSTKTSRPPAATPGYRRQARLAEPTPIAPPFKSSARGFFIEVVKVVAIALAIIIPVRFFLIQPFYVKGASMEPNFQDHEYLIIDEISFRLRQPRRGEVVVIRSPQQRREFFIKRLIGLPGETVTIANDKISITSDQYPHGFVLDESSYLPTTTDTHGQLVTALGSDEYFVLGDNRPASLDSRVFGPITKSDIIGRAWLRAWPLTAWRSFSAPLYSRP